MRFITFIILVLSSVGFFNYHGILSDSMQKYVFYLCAFAATGVGISKGRRLRDAVNDGFPDKIYVVLLMAIAFSAVMATAFHPQSLIVSLLTTVTFLVAYATVYPLLMLDIDNDRIIKAYIYMCAVSTFVYFCNVLTMPNNIFGQPILNEDMTRGIIRIPVVFIEFMPMLVFYAINRFIETKKKKWLAIIAWISVMIFLAVIRQIIALTAVLGLWFFFKNISWVKKISLVIAAVLVVAFVLPQIPMYKTMLEFSEDQRDDNETGDENIRITAWRYYTYDNQTNALSPVFGNGMPSFGNSRWGIMMDSETEDNGCYGADVGWAGFFWYFGGIATLCLLIVLIKALLKKKKARDQYLNYWLVFLIVTSIASGPILYYWQILDITVCLAMIYGTSANSTANDAVVKESDEPEKSLDWRTRYPQLSK